MVEDRRKDSREATKKAEHELEKRIETILHRLNIPTSNDIKALNTKITTLSRKVDELKKATSHPVTERVSQN
jgi:poly(hydroxyalkanoate) granule-associated protein